MIIFKFFKNKTSNASMLCLLYWDKTRPILFGFNEFSQPVLETVVKIAGQEQKASQNDKGEEAVDIAQISGIDKKYFDDDDSEQRDCQEALVGCFLNDSRRH